MWMLAVDQSGNKLLELIDISEEDAPFNNSNKKIDN